MMKKKIIHSSDPFFKWHKRSETHPEEFCKRMHKQITIQKEMLKKFDYIEDRGKKCVDWIEKFCVLPSGEHAGEPVKLDLWAKWFIYSIFNFYGNFEVEKINEDGDIVGYEFKYIRVVNDVLLLIGSGNAKTTVVSFIISYILYSKEFNNPNIYIGSNAHEQSKICFDATVTCLNGNKILKRNAQIVESKSFIKVKQNNALLKAMSSNGKNLEGIIPCLIEVDEIHEMVGNKYAEDLKKSTKREDFLYMETTTQGTVRGGRLDSRLEEADVYLDGSEKDYRKLFAIFEQDSEEEIYEALEKNKIYILKKSNPSLGVAVSFILLKQKIKDMLIDPKKRMTTLTKNFNIPQNPETSFFTEPECRTLPFNEKVLYGAPVTLGFDMAYLRTPESDLPALRIMLKNPMTEESYNKDIYFIPKYWIYQEHKNGNVIEKKLDMVKYKSKEDSNIIYDKQNGKYGYQLYANRGDVVIVDETLVDKLVKKYGQKAYCDCTGITEEFIIYYIANLQSELKLQIIKVGLDPNKAGKIEAFLNANLKSIDGRDIVVKFQMEKTNISNPVIEKVKEERNRKIVHNNNKLTELHFAEVQVKETSNGFKLVNQQRKRKDGVIAECAASSAFNVFTTNKFTGAKNSEILKAWWKKNESRINSLLEE